jgi:hypothetical protein
MIKKVSGTWFGSFRSKLWKKGITLNLEIGYYPSKTPLVQ